MIETCHGPSQIHVQFRRGCEVSGATRDSEIVTTKGEMDATERIPPHLQLTVPMPIKTGKVAMSPGEDGLIGIPFPEHSNELLSHLNDQRRSGLLCDLTLTSHGAHYPTHRSVMAAVSVYFRHLFGAEEGGGEGGGGGGGGFTVCQLDCVAPDALDALLEFAYTATLTIPSSGMRDVLRAAQLLGIQCVADACREILGETEETETPAEEYKVQQTPPKKTLKDECVEKVSRRKTDKKRVKKIGSNHTSVFTPPSPLSHQSPASDSLRSLPSTQPPSPEKDELHLKFGLNGDHRPFPEQEVNGGLARWLQDRSHSRPSSAPRSIDKLSEEDDIEGFVDDEVLMKSASTPTSVAHREAAASAAGGRKRKSQTPQQCPVCQKIIHGAGKLPRHMRTHTGEKPFQCTVCEVRFTRNDKLKIHMRKHTGERPYPCQHCPARFLHSYDLKNHLSLHSGARPFECPLCHKAFAREDHLQRHRKGHSCLEVRTRRPRRGPEPGDELGEDGKEPPFSMQGHSSGYLASALRESVKSGAGPPLQMFQENTERERTMALQALAQLAPLRLAAHPAFFLRSLELHGRQAEESGRARALALQRGTWAEDVADEDAEGEE